MRFSWLGLALLLLAGPVLAADTDGDSIPDLLDKCATDSRNTTFTCDHDGDGYGNVCDADFNQNEAVNAVDHTEYFIPAFKGFDPSPWPEGMDMNCNGSVNAVDFTEFFQPQYQAGTLGPSSVACAGLAGALCKPNLEARMVGFELGGVDLSGTVTQNEPLHPDDISTGDPNDSESYPGGLARESHDLSLSAPVLVDHSSTELPFAWPTKIVRSVGTATTGVGDWATIESSNSGVSEQTVCNRFYFSYSEGFADGGNSAADVVLFLANFDSITADPAIRFRWNSGTLTLDKGLSTTDFGGSGSTALSGSGVTRAECVTEWCRFEACFDHDEQENDTNKVRIRGSVEIVTGANAGQLDTVDETLPNAGTVLGPGGTSGLLFSGVSATRAWFDADEYIDLANWLSVQFNAVDIGQEIGPAYEIEGF